jgi:CheY-like chemotaxis protein
MAETTLQGTLRRALGGVGTNVLLVTDEPPASGIVAAALAQEGFAVEATCNGDDALRRLQAGPPVDVMITEIALPGGMDGAALARRARELRPDLPIVYNIAAPLHDRQARSRGRRDVRCQAVRSNGFRPLAAISGRRPAHACRRLGLSKDQGRAWPSSNCRANHS